VLAELARDGDGTAVRKFLNSLLPEANLGVRRATRDGTRKSDGVAMQRGVVPPVS